MGQLDGVAPEELAEKGAALTGVLRVPVIPIVYAGTKPPFDYRMLADRLFGGSRGDTLSYLEYWREVSGGLLQVTGAVAPWITLPNEASHYLSEEEYGWARFGRTVEFREEAIRGADQALDFGRFDNDGPDGIPNSGDDDGFVDFAAMVYALPCGADWRAGAIWPHRGAMPPFETDDRAANGGRIKVTDYVILPAIEPGTCTPLHIGVLTHETGHVLGLPDLYDFDGSSQGIGAWGLMAMGAHAERWSPAHLSAWAKAQLGWVRVEQLGGDGDAIEFPPVEREPVVFRYDLPGRLGEYLLLENRQHLGSDAHLPGEGLLVWRINPDRAELGSWNSDELRRAVGLVEADGRADLAHGGAADAGDPFPGETRQGDLDLQPSIPLRLSSIEERGDVITANIAFGFDEPRLVAVPGVVRLAASEGGEAVEQTVQVRPQGGAPAVWNVHGATKDWLDISEQDGELVVRADPAGLRPGEYEATIELSPVVAVRPPVPSDPDAPERPGAPVESSPGDDARSSAPGDIELLGRPVSRSAAPPSTHTETARTKAAPAAQPRKPDDGLVGTPLNGSRAASVLSAADAARSSTAARDVRSEPVPPKATSAAQPTKPDGTLAGTPLTSRVTPAAGERRPEEPAAVPGRVPTAGHVTVHLTVAARGVAEVIATGLSWSWGLGARDGRLFQAGYGWDPLALRPRPRVLSLRDGERSASTLARIPADALYAPASASGGSAYVLARARGENYIYRVDGDGGAEVVASRLGDVPAYGIALAPGGNILLADWNGGIRRVAPDGTVTWWGAVEAHTYQIATDGAGALFAATYGGDIVRIDRNGRRTLLPTGFGPGRLVSIVATASGTVFAAERGGGGRILRIEPDGRREVVTRVEGAEFYGLALDRGFLYALDLGHGQLLRIALGRNDTPPAVAVW